MEADLIIDILSRFRTVDLTGLERVKLMNRLDTKYVFSGHRLPDILEKISSSYRVLEIDDVKLLPYETIYFDTEGFYFFRQHVTSNPVRYKVRNRKYLSTGSSFLEIKKRIGNCRTVKWRIENDPASFGQLDEEAQNFIATYLKWSGTDLKPVLINKFKRITLVDSDFRERATVDLDLSFADMSGNLVYFPFIAIVEVKREGPGRLSAISETLKKFYISPSGFSKYCIGISSLHDIPSGNILRGKISQIKKIENEYNKYCSA